MTNYKIYNADAATMEEVERVMTIEDQLLEMVAQQQKFITMQNGLIKLLKENKKDMSTSYSLAADFIFNNEDLHDDYVSHLKSCKAATKIDEERECIEYILTEYGADEKTEKWLQEEMKMMDGGIN
ncbi:hypothetical protein [Alkalihalophilus marmarensis]|uniref:Uncharacterized protein n=1 Tax=Alkalihalophilus marmarensis DSM 21297 TaxID=1188261 RepID=U6SRP5_9BACI|nr:hypothetical protein [Alkalihalophilus marmarensis]ERN54303.1 hypothetical protein A33I_07705 [Alkalihalophilus marmarensis DSM 21297]